MDLIDQSLGPLAREKVREMQRALEEARERQKARDENPSKRSHNPARRTPVGRPKKWMRDLEARIKAGVAQRVIAAEFGIAQSQVSRLRTSYVDIGWSLSRSDPDLEEMSINDGLVYLPPPEKARKIRESERSRR
jgi:hypothetical protein